MPCGSIVLPLRDRVSEASERSVICSFHLSEVRRLRQFGKSKQFGMKLREFSASFSRESCCSEDQVHYLLVVRGPACFQEIYSMGHLERLSHAHVVFRQGILKNLLHTAGTKAMAA